MHHTSEALFALQHDLHRASSKCSHDTAQPVCGVLGRAGDGYSGRAEDAILHGCIPATHSHAALPRSGCCAVVPWAPGSSWQWLISNHSP